MTRAEAIEILKQFKMCLSDIVFDERGSEAWQMAISALENIGHLTDRPCDVCEFKKENGCCKWTCVFCDSLFGEMR